MSLPECRTVAKLEFEVPQGMARPVLRELEGIGIQDVLVQSGRLSQLAPPARFSLIARDRLEESPSTIIRTWVPPALEKTVLGLVSMVCKLDIPGRGSAWSQEVQLWCPRAFARNLDNIPLPQVETVMEFQHFLSGIVGIQFILQRGLASLVARSALDQGTCVPGVVFGQGAGMRDKLGLLRITIPAEKEVLQIMVPDHDALGITLRLMEEAKLNQAGKSFISWFPVRQALLNTRLHLGRQGHAASMEQVIGAIDNLKGDTLWRRRFDLHDQAAVPGLKDLTAIQVLSDEADAPELSALAMAAGAPGGTVQSLQYQHLGRGEAWTGEAAKTLSMMVVSASQAGPIMDAIRQHRDGAALANGYMEVHPRPRAFTYLSGSR